EPSRISRAEVYKSRIIHPVPSIQQAEERERIFSFTMSTSADREIAVPGLRRALKLRHLILYGIIIIQPTAPMSIYGVVSNAARGHVVTTTSLRWWLCFSPR